MGEVFQYCTSLSSLPDISKWNMKNVTSMRNIFSKCSSLNQIPDISKWNTEKNENITGLFLQCSSLAFIPDISKWNFNNIKYKLKYVYDDCLSLIKIIKQLGEQNIDDLDEENNDDSSSSSAFGSFDMDEPFVTPLIKAFAKALGEYVEKDPDDSRTDAYWLRRNYVTVTPVHIDQTDYEAMSKVDELLKGF